MDGRTNDDFDYNNPFSDYVYTITLGCVGILSILCGVFSFVSGLLCYYGIELGYCPSSIDVLRPYMWFGWLLTLNATFLVIELATKSH